MGDESEKVVECFTSFGQRVVEDSLHGHTAAPVGPADAAAVLADVRAEDAITADVLAGERNRRAAGLLQVTVRKRRRVRGRPRVHL